VTVQMLADLLLIGVIANVLIGVAQRRRQALATPETQPVDSDRDVVAPHTDRQPRLPGRTWAKRGCPVKASETRPSRYRGQP
jgi:hypothetical protein